MNRQGATLSAWAGHVVDLWRLVRFDVRDLHSYGKFRQLKAMARRSGASMLIEAGTYVGNTAMRASRAFDRVITIELSPELHRQASGYLARRKNVECILGDASKVLPEVLARPDVKDALIFLDGHFSHADTTHGDEIEPACTEIRDLAAHKDKIAGIVVDDFREFGTQPGFPRKSELLRTIEESFADYQVAVHLDQVLIWRKGQASS